VVNGGRRTVLGVAERERVRVETGATDNGQLANGATGARQRDSFAEYPSPPRSAELREIQGRVKNWASIPHMWKDHIRCYGDLPCIVDHHNGVRVSMTYAQVAEEISKVAAGLRKLGVSFADIVSIFSENSYRWLVVDQSILTLGAVDAVRGSEAPVSELHYIYEHSGSKALVVQNGALIEVLRRHKELSNVNFILVLWGPAPKDIGIPVYTYEEVLELGSNSPRVEPVASRSDVATLVYTSGTTGQPKGVVLTHHNLLYQAGVIGVGERIEPRPGETFVSILPCWHIFERTAEYYVLARGVGMVYSNVRHFKDDLASYKPQILIAVPRVLESLYSAVIRRVASASIIRKAMFNFFLTVSTLFLHARRLVLGLSVHHPKPMILWRLAVALTLIILGPLHALATKLAWKKIKDGLGGRIKIAVIGGGATAMFLEDFFEAVGVTITVGYGMTETSPVLTNRFDGHNVRGSCGVALPQTSVRVVDPETRQVLPCMSDGVITVKGPGVTNGYYKDEEATLKAFDEEGYFDTGDLGHFLPRGSLVITGRKKDMVVLSNGENILCQPVEDAILESPAVDQVMLVGQDQRALGALIVPQLDTLYAQGFIPEEMKDKINASDPKQLRRFEEELMANRELEKFIRKEIDLRVTSRRGYNPVERIRVFRILLQPFTVENGMMTQTLKVKKNIVSQIFKKEIEKLYAD